MSINIQSGRVLWFRVLIPIFLIIVWLAIAGIGGPTFGKLSSVAVNDQGSFLPANADATKVQNMQAKFINSRSIPAVVVVSSSQKLQPAQLRQLTTLTPSLAQTAGVSSGTQSVVGPIPSQDGKAAEFIVQVQGKLATTVDNLSATVKKTTPAGTQAYVTGPAGLAADLFKAFGGIDGVLLYVALVAVFLILLLVYRSVVLPFLVLITAMFGLTAAGLVVYHSVTGGILKLNGQSQGILSILAIGAATDYSLLIIARYREALQHYAKPLDAMLHALRNSIEPISASAATVIAGVLCLLFSELTSNRDLGPVAALGILFSYLSAMTLLPALLVLLGRIAFWPFRPKLADSTVQPSELKTGLEDRRGLWQRVPALIARHPRAVWLACFAALAVFALMTPQFKASGVSQSDTILGKSDAVTGQKIVAEHFPAGTGSPAVIIADASKLHTVADAIERTPGIGNVDYLPAAQANKQYVHEASPYAPAVIDGKIMLTAELEVPADSSQAMTVVEQLRQNVSEVDSGALVGGVSAIRLDSNDAATADLRKIIPIVLVVILFILMLLLRSLVAPALLVASVILSFSATIGISALVFNHLFRFPGSDAAIPLFAFIFLVALGVDYNIFLMTRVREEAKKRGSRAGILRGLSVTGSVITSAGVVLAATFAALAVVPILFLAQIAFIVAFGVLLDTIIVRSLLVPAVSYDIGKRIWWPSKLWRSGR